MKLKLVIGTMTAIFAATAARATEVVWNGDGAYNLGSSDVMTLSANTTITSASTFTGTGKIVVADGTTLTLDYKTENSGDAVSNPFTEFFGSVQIDSGALVQYSYPSGSGTHNDSNYDVSVFGRSAAVIFNGGTLKGFSKQNNTAMTGPFVINADSRLENVWASSGGQGGNGVNIRFRDSVSFSGSGTLTIESSGRWIEFGSGVGFSGFEGGIVLSGSANGECSFYGVDYGQNAAWTFRPSSTRSFKLAPPANENEVVFGAVSTSPGATLTMSGSGRTIRIGSKAGSDSVIEGAFAGDAVVLNKVGAGRLTMKQGATMVSGSTVAVSSGVVSVGSQAILDIVQLGENASLALNFSNPSTESAGLSLAGVTLPAGAVVTNEVNFTSAPADGSTYTLVTSDVALDLDDFALALTSTCDEKVAGGLSLSSDEKSLLLTVGTYPATPHLWVPFTGGDSSSKGSVGFSSGWAPAEDVPNAADYAAGHEGDNGAYLPNGGKNGTSGRYPRAKHMSYTGPSNFTLFFTVRSVDTENAVLLHLGYFNNSHRGNLLLRSGGAGKVKLSTMDTQNSSPVDAVVADVPSASLLSHAYAIAYDFAAKTLKLYVDGEYIGVANGFGDPGTGLMPDGSTVYNGGISASDFRFGYTGGNKFTMAPGMLVDDFRCYEKMVLSDMAIKAISSELGPWADGLKYGYESDSTTGVTTFVIDDAAQGNSEVMLIKGVDTADFTLSHFAAKVSNRNGYKAKLRMENGNLVAKVSPTAFVVVVR